MEAESAGRAFADGRRFSVMGKAPTTAALFRGPGEEQEPEADRELDAAMQKVLDRQAARGAAIERYRKERKDYILANLEYREYDVPVDERLRKMPATQQPQELWMRVLEMEFPSISREDAEEVLRRTGMETWSAESDSIAEQIRTRDKINFRTKFMRLLAEVYNEIAEDRMRASLNVDELLNPGPDMALEMFKDVGRGYYNGLLGFGQGLVDLPAAPVNLIQSLRGREQIHLLDLSGLRADYHTSYGLHFGSSIELGTQLGLMVVSGKLPLGAGTGAAVNTASKASRAVQLLSAWNKINAVSAGATAVVQAGQAIRDISRGYVIEDGKKRPLTEDDILNRLAGIAFGVHAATGALRSTAGKLGSGSPTTDLAVPEMTIERTTPSSIQVSVPGEAGKLVIDDAGWRVLAGDGQVLAQGSADEGALLASQLGEAQPTQPAPPSTTAAPPGPGTISGQTTQTPAPGATLSALQGGSQYSGKPRGLVFDADSASRSMQVDTSHPIFKNRLPANEQDVPPAPQAKAMQAGAPPAREAADMPKAQELVGVSSTGGAIEPTRMGSKVPPSSHEVGSVSSDVQSSPGGKTRRETVEEYKQRGGRVTEGPKPEELEERGDLKKQVEARPKSGPTPPEDFGDVFEQTGVSEGKTPRSKPSTQATEAGQFAHAFYENVEDMTRDFARGAERFVDDVPQGPHVEKEFSIDHPDYPPGRKPRIDRLDWENAEIYEIKPNTSEWIARGKAQAQQYAEWMNKYHKRPDGKLWKVGKNGGVITYNQSALLMFLKEIGYFPSFPRPTDVTQGAKFPPEPAPD
jgi:hypothetical protein